MKPLLRLPPGDSSCADNFGAILSGHCSNRSERRRFAAGVCLRLGPFLLVFVFKVKA